MFAIRPYAPGDRAALHALIRTPSLQPEFGWVLDNGELDDPVRHPFGEALGAWVAESGRAMVGFSTLVRFPAESGDWALMRVGVHDTHRRRGIGRALAAATEEARQAAHAAVRKVGHWEPSRCGEPFARALGFTHDRWFWTMERPGITAPALGWPEGIEARTFDGSDRAFEEWNDCYNRAFATQTMNITSTVEQCRRLAARPDFDPEGMIMVRRQGRCVGFCRCAITPEFGDLDVLCVTPEARGIGLGRGLVRWGTAWLIERRAPNVRLMVDGDNERASRLYRSEGFEVIRTRRIWRMA